MYLLDTNVISETMKPIRNAVVEEWMDENEENTFISAVSIEEMRYGQLVMPEGKRRNNLRIAIDNIVKRYSGSILSYGEYDAGRCATFHARALKSGRTPSLGDLMIAAIAYTHGLILVTRNVKDFEYLPIRIFNPFKEKTSE